MSKGIKIFFYVFLISLSIGSGIFAGFFMANLSNLPRIDQLKEYRPSTITKIYSKEGEIIAEFFRQRREIVPLSEIPSSLQQAFLASEDRNFYKHGAIDLRGILRMLWVNLKARKVVEGGSTITQQLAKNLFLTQERTITRKIKEIILAIQIERNYSKKEIFEMYLNQICFGNGVYGVKEASSFYLGKELNELNLAESAFLVTIPRGPTYYSPLKYPEHTLNGKDSVLNKMYKFGFITREEWEKIKQMPIKIVEGKRRTRLGNIIHYAPYFVEYVRQQIEEKYGYKNLWEGGLKIYTTLNLKMQKAAEEVLVPYLTEKNWQGALLSMDPHTGFVRAMVGGKDFFEETAGEYNRALQAHRQTGSAFKLFTYTAAIDSKKFNAVSAFYDAPISFETKAGIWSPENYEKYYWGEVYLWEMFAHSINVSSVKLLEKVGVEKVIKYAHQMGIETKLNPYLSLTLGTSSLSLIEMVRGYATIANYGVKVKPIFIQKVEDREGKILEENFPQGEIVLSPQTSYIMIDLLKKTIDHGTGRRVRSMGFKRPCGGKTGTVGWKKKGEEDSDKTKDAWFIGFTPDLVAGIWIGNDDGSPLGDKITGSAACIPVWVNFMKRALIETPVKDFPAPSQVVFKKIDTKTGFLATPNSKNALWFAFLEGTAPTKYASLPSTKISTNQGLRKTANWW